MKVIFLDVDGVLNSDEYLNGIIGTNVTGIAREVDIKKVRLLKQAVNKTGAKIVVTSSIRLSPMGRELKEVLQREGMLVDATPFINEERGIEIKAWIKLNGCVEDFVILDDEIFDSFDEYLSQRLIKISNENGSNIRQGLQLEDVAKIITRLGERKIDDDLER